MKLSAGLLLYRIVEQRVDVLLVHMGGPFWARKDEHAWSIPKGEYDEGMDPAAAAVREFTEELGAAPPAGATIELGTARQSGKTVTAFAREGDFDAADAVSNTFSLEWPPRSGRFQDFPEVDRAEWFDLPTAADKLVKGQVVFLTRLANRLAGDPPASGPRP
ncbi:MAG TPA: NUDIX domain-containing protein [Nakamurella sp.]